MDDFIMIGDNKEQLIEVMQKFISYIREKLDLTVKPNWEVFPIDYIDSHKKRHGSPIDMMGYVIYRDHTVIRTCIFLSIRRSYLREARRYANKRPRKRIPVEAAHRCVSYFGWLKNSSSGTFIFKYNVKVIFSLAKWSVSKFNRDKNQCSEKRGT